MNLQTRVFLSTSLLLYFTRFAFGERTLPPPLPEHIWNHTSLNYTELHLKYSEALFCMSPPVGVYGFWYRTIWLISACLSYIYGLFTGAVEGTLLSILNFLAGFVPAGFGTFLLYQQIDALSSCTAYSSQLRHLRGIGIASAIFNGLFVVGACLSSLMPGASGFIQQIPILSPQLVGVVGICCTAGLQFIIANADFGIPFGIDTLPKGYAPGFAIWIPFGVCIAYGFFTKSLTNYKRYFCFHLSGTAILAAIHYFDGTSALRLGMMLGDPYGSSFIKGDWANQMDVVLMGGVPVVQLVILALALAYSPEKRRVASQELGVERLPESRK